MGDCSHRDYGPETVNNLGGHKKARLIKCPTYWGHFRNRAFSKTHASSAILQATNSSLLAFLYLL